MVVGPYLRARTFARSDWWNRQALRTMRRLTALVISHDDAFRSDVARLVRGAGFPVGIVEERQLGSEASPDLSVVDIRGNAATGMTAIERVRASWPAVAVFAIASEAAPDMILQAMRAGANEFFTWPAAGDAAASGMQSGFHEALRRTAARLQAQSGGKQPSVTLAFLGAKGGTGTTTMAVNCAVELARQGKRATVVVDLKPSVGEVALFLGVRARFTLLDAVENLHRLDREFLSELVAKHKSGLDILAGSEEFDRPNGQDTSAIEELMRALGGIYDFIVVDAGSLINACSVSTLYGADAVYLVVNPDVPSIRNAQRIVHRIGQLGAGRERVQILLNRVSEQHLVAPKQIGTALGHSIAHTFPSDYGTVSSALNSGVPLALSNHSELADQFGKFTRQILGQFAQAGETPESARRGPFLGLF